MLAIITNLVNKYGYFGIVFLIAVENIFPPIPSEVILTFGGFATTISNLSVIGTIVSATIGSVVGAIMLYFIGKALNREKIDKIIRGKIGKVLRLKSKDINKAFDWFDNRGKYAVFFGRFIPIVRSLISIPAGMAKMNMIPFIVLTTIGSLIWNTALIILGRVAGNSWGIVASYVEKYSNIVLVMLVFILISVIFSFYYKKKKKIIYIRMKK